MARIRIQNADRYSTVRERHEELLRNYAGGNDEQRLEMDDEMRSVADSYVNTAFRLRAFRYLSPLTDARSALEFGAPLSLGAIAASWLLIDLL